MKLPDNVTVKVGNMFDDEHDCYVNTINTVGAMGAGIALEFKNRYMNMFLEYRRLTDKMEIAVGDCWVYQNNATYLAALAVKNDWRYRIRIAWAKLAVRNFVNLIQSGKLPVKSVAMPRIGSKNGSRGAKFELFDDNWPDNPEEGYQALEPFILSELAKCKGTQFTIYKK